MQQSAPVEEPPSLRSYSYQRLTGYVSRSAPPFMCYYTMPCLDPSCIQMMGEVFGRVGTITSLSSC